MSIFSICRWQLLARNASPLGLSDEKADSRFCKKIDDNPNAMVVSTESCLSPEQKKPAKGGLEMLHEAQGGTAFVRASHAGSMVAFANGAPSRRARYGCSTSATRLFRGEIAASNPFQSRLNTGSLVKTWFQCAKRHRAATDPKNRLESEPRQRRRNLSARHRTHPSVDFSEKRFQSRLNFGRVPRQL